MRGFTTEYDSSCHLLFVWLCRLDPLIINNPTSGARQTSVTFAKNSEVNSLYNNTSYESTS